MTHHDEKIIDENDTTEEQSVTPTDVENNPSQEKSEKATFWIDTALL